MISLRISVRTTAVGRSKLCGSVNIWTWESARGAVFHLCVRNARVCAGHCSSSGHSLCSCRASTPKGSLATARQLHHLLRASAAPTPRTNPVPAKPMGRPNARLLATERGASGSQVRFMEAFAGGHAPESRERAPRQLSAPIMAPGTTRWRSTAARNSAKRLAARGCPEKSQVCQRRRDPPGPY
jgi:hypothetical protein